MQVINWTVTWGSLLVTFIKIAQHYNVSCFELLNAIFNKNVILTEYFYCVSDHIRLGIKKTVDLRYVTFRFIMLNLSNIFTERSGIRTIVETADLFQCSSRSKRRGDTQKVTEDLRHYNIQFTGTYKVSSTKLGCLNKYPYSLHPILELKKSNVEKLQYLWPTF
jgi:hypothetical protein